VYACVYVCVYVCMEERRRGLFHPLRMPCI
jgi:hypothetical protein